MSKRFMLAVWDLDLPRPEKAVLAAFAWNADAEGKHSRPSIGKVGERSGYSDRQVFNIVASLKQRGILKAERRLGRPHGFVTEFSIDLSGVPQKSAKIADLSTQELQTLSLQKLQTSKVKPNKHAASSAGSTQKLQTLSVQSGVGSLQSDCRLKSATDCRRIEDLNRKAEQAKPTPEVFSLLPAEEKSKTAPKNRKQNWVPPGWVSKTQWEGYSEMRKKIGAPLTDRACELIITELEKLKASGHDAGAVLDQSTVNNWKRIFPITGGSNGNHNNRGHDRTANNLAVLNAVFPLDR
jgi:hypothetical protein